MVEILGVRIDEEFKYKKTDEDDDYPMHEQPLKVIQDEERMIEPQDNLIQEGT